MSTALHAATRRRLARFLGDLPQFQRVRAIPVPSRNAGKPRRKRDGVGPGLRVGMAAMIVKLKSLRVSKN